MSEVYEGDERRKAILNLRGEHQKSVEAAKNTIARAASDAATVVANAASRAVRELANERLRSDVDHDLLVELRTELKGLKADVRDIKDGTKAQIANLEKCKVDVEHSYPTVYKPEVDRQFETITNRLNAQSARIDGLAKLVYIGLGIVLVLNVMALIIAPLLHVTM